MIALEISENDLAMASSTLLAGSIGEVEAPRLEEEAPRRLSLVSRRFSLDAPSLATAVEGAGVCESPWRSGTTIEAGASERLFESVRA